MSGPPVFRAVVAGLDANSLVERVEHPYNHFSQVRHMTFCSRRYSVYGNG
jgi:hypothetical protein